jgi:hypothetical protein
MKGRKAHTVVLSSQACDVLREAAKFCDGPFVFPGDVEMTNGGRHPISDASMLMCLRKFHATATVHGTARSSFKDYITESSVF